MRTLETILAIASLVVATEMVFGAEAEFVQENCASCHALTEPDFESLGIEARAERKAPPLYYAGDKYRRNWLVEWLQAPERIRPAGVYPPAHIRSTPDGDKIDEASLPTHVVLDQSQAEQVADYLSSLRPYQERIDSVTYEPGSISWRMGQMNFVKFNNCSGCHQDEPGYGGVSGPELHTAWDRLRPEFIFSYTKDPVRWDPHTMMPGGDLNEAAVEKLANYLKAVSEEAE